MYYIDTSVLVAYYCPEEISEKVEAFLLGLKSPSISTLTELELFSAVSRKIREGHMKKQDGDRITALFLSHINENFYNYIPIKTHHYRLARDWIGMFATPLRTLDALHLAVASTEELILVTVDKILARSAELLSVKTVVL